MERYLPASADVVSAELARAVHDYVRREQLGYYPALDFLQEQGCIDRELLEAADNIAWFVSGVAREEIQRRLRPVFASLSFDSVQSTAFALPTVRPGHANALHDLERHYRLDTVKLAMNASSFQTHDDPEATRKWARHLLWRWLKDVFAHLDVTSARLV